MNSHSDTAPLLKTDRENTKRSKRWCIRWPWLYVPLAIVISVITGMTPLLLIGAMIPGNRSFILGITVIIFPMLAGCILNYSLGQTHPWRGLLRLFLTGLAFGIAAWSIYTLKG